MAPPLPACDLALGPFAEPLLDPLVGVDRDEPVGIVLPRRLDEAAVIHRVVPDMRVAWWIADQLQDSGVPRHEFG
jgi:hypothetical protein